MVKGKVDLSLYLVTQRGGLSDEAFYGIVLKAVEGGVTVVQLREKGIEYDEFKRVGEGLLRLLRPRGVPLIINDSIEVAKAIGAEGVHVGQGDVDIALAREVLGEDAVIGLSVETLDQGESANGLDVDYIAASPVFGTATKLDVGIPFGVEGVEQLCALSRHPVVGIGGIHEDNLVDVMSKGLNGVAVVSAIFGTEDPMLAARNLRRIIENGHQRNR